LSVIETATVLPFLLHASYLFI